MLIFRDVPVSLHAGDMFWTFRSTINALCWFCFRVFSGQSLLHLIGLLGFVIWIALLCFAGITRLCTCRPFIYLDLRSKICVSLACEKYDVHLFGKKSMSKRVVWLSIRSLVFVNELFVYQSSPVALHAVFDGWFQTLWSLFGGCVTSQCAIFGGVGTHCLALSPDVSSTYSAGSGFVTHTLFHVPRFVWTRLGVRARAGRL